MSKTHNHKMVTISEEILEFIRRDLLSGKKSPEELTEKAEILIAKGYLDYDFLDAIVNAEDGEEISAIEIAKELAIFWILWEVL